jgi:hypothetical protein
VVHEPSRDARPVEAAKTFEPRHLHPDAELLQADSAFCIIDAVLLCRGIRIHPRPALSSTGHLTAAGSARAGVRAVRLDAGGDVRLTQLLEVFQIA